MNFGSSVGGLTLMLLSVVWLAIFVPQWARKAQEPSQPRRQRQNFSDNRSNSAQSALESQMLRLTHTRSRMAAVAVVTSFVWIGVFLLTSGTPLALLVWPIGVVVAGSAALSLAAGRRLMVLAGNSRSVRIDRLTTSSKAPAVNLSAQPLPRRGWTPSPIPDPIREHPAGEIVMRGAKVVPMVDVTTPKAPVASEPPEIRSAEIDEILRRRRAN